MGPQPYVHTHQQLGPPLSPSSRTISFHPHPHFGLWASAPESLGLKPSTSGPQSPHLFHIPAARATFGPSSRTTTYTQPHTQPHSPQGPTTMKLRYSTYPSGDGQPTSFTFIFHFTNKVHIYNIHLPIKLPAWAARQPSYKPARRVQTSVLKTTHRLNTNSPFPAYLLVVDISQHEYLVLNIQGLH